MRRSLLHLAVAQALAVMLLPSGAQADPDGCAPGSGASALCSGNQSGGIATGPTPLTTGGVLQSPPVVTINVNNLTQGITPAAGTPGILFHNQAGSALTLTAGDGVAYPSITATGNGAGGIVVNGFGTPTRTINFFGWDLPVGGGGHGGNLTVNSSANVKTDGNDAPGISARSRAGGYSDAVVATLLAYGGQFGSNARTNAVALKLSIPF